MLEELLTQIDASGLTKGVPRGAMWDFQRDGYLPFERTAIPVGQRTPVMDDMIEHIQPTLIVDESVSLDAQPTPEIITEEGWEEMPAPSNEEQPEQEDEYVPEVRRPMEEDRVDLEAELARLDAERKSRGETTPEVKVDPHLAALENQLSELDF